LTCRDLGQLPSVLSMTTNYSGDPVDHCARATASLGDHALALELHRSRHVLLQV
jgi:hypothetical protein